MVRGPFDANFALCGRYIRHVQILCSTVLLVHQTIAVVEGPPHCLQQSPCQAPETAAQLISTTAVLLQSKSDYDASHARLLSFNQGYPGNPDFGA